MHEVTSIAFVFFSIILSMYIEKSQGEHSEINLEYDLISPSKENQKNLNPVILVHGFFDERATWKDIAPVIANETGRKVYMVDLRNHGDSPWTDEMSFDILAEDLNDFMIQHDIPKAILLGHSAGGKATLTLALKKPEKVEKLIVEDMIVDDITFIPYSVASILLKLLRMSLAIIPPGTDKNTAQNIFFKFVLKKLPDNLVPCQMSNFDIIPVKHEGDKYKWKTNIDGIERAILSGNGPVFGQDLSSYEPYAGEALFIYGTRSVFKKANDKLLLKYFPRAIKLGFEGATHLIHHEYSEDYAREVVQFINGKIKPKRSKCPGE